jgi:hypothetical protein
VLALTPEKPLRLARPITGRWQWPEGDGKTGGFDIRRLESSKLSITKGGTYAKNHPILLVR